jgi:DNA mismatch repair protein MutS2
MQPLFHLDIGKPGSSFAFEIGRKIGLPEEILNDASRKAGVENIKYDRHLKDIARDKRYWEKKRQNIRHHEKRLEKLIEEYEKEFSGVKAASKEIIAKAKDEAQNLLKESNRIIENTIRQIKESQAEKEKTRDIRKQLEQFRDNVAGKSGTGESGAEKRVEAMAKKAKKYKSKGKSIVTKDHVTKEKPIEVGCRRGAGNKR